MKKSLITLGIIIGGGVIAIVIAQEFTPEDFALGDYEAKTREVLEQGRIGTLDRHGNLNLPGSVDSAEDQQANREAAEKQFEQRMLKEDAERRAGVDVDARNQQQRDQQMQETRQYLDQLRQRN